MLGSRKPLQLSHNVLGGYSKIVGVGAFIPAMENQIVTDEFENVNNNKFVGNLPNSRKYNLTDYSGISQCVWATNTQLQIGNLVQTFSTNTPPLPPIQQQPTDPQPANSEQEPTTTADRNMPFFATCNGFNIKMLVNNKNDNPLSFNFMPNYTAIPTKVETTIATAETHPHLTQTELDAENLKRAKAIAKKKASSVFWNTEDSARLIPISYDIKPQTRVDFIIDVNEQNICNYTDTETTMKIYLKFE